mmetsp:Transcript_92/g.346  ORF Transcript_92/g.346 Transcript_92/m.346 type:complete len:221 (+) Transcript_92:1045-1707(+)
MQESFPLVTAVVPRLCPHMHPAQKNGFAQCVKGMSHGEICIGQILFHLMRMSLGPVSAWCTPLEDCVRNGGCMAISFGQMPLDSKVFKHVFDERCVLKLGRAHSVLFDPWRDDNGGNALAQSFEAEIVLFFATITWGNCTRWWHMIIRSASFIKGDQKHRVVSKSRFSQSTVHLVQQIVTVQDRRGEHQCALVVLGGMHAVAANDETRLNKRKVRQCAIL